MSDGPFSVFAWKYTIQVIRNSDGTYNPVTKAYTGPASTPTPITGHPAPAFGGDETRWKPLRGSANVILREGDMRFATSEELDANDTVIIWDDEAGTKKRRYTVEAVGHHFGWMMQNHLGITRFLYLLREEQHNATA